MVRLLMSAPFWRRPRIRQKEDNGRLVRKNFEVSRNLTKSVVSEAERIEKSARDVGPNDNYTQM